MAEARQLALGPNAFAELYKASRYEKVSIRTLGPFVQFGFKSTIPPAGGDDAIRMITTDDMEFFIGPGDTIYVGNPGGAATNVQILASPLPWPLEFLEILGIRSPRKTEAFFFPNVPVAPGNPVKAFTAEEYVELAASIRVSTPGNGQLSFRSSMDANYVVPSGFPFDRFIMAPGDTLYLQGLTGAMDWQIVASPAPWWNGELRKVAPALAERFC